MNDVTTTEETRRDLDIYKPADIIAPERMEFLWTMADRVAMSYMVPESLRTFKPKNSSQLEDLPIEHVKANVFMVFEQAERWRMSPFALLQCAAMVYGKLGFEGKVIAAVLESRFGIELGYEWSGEGDAMEISISGVKPGTSKVLVLDGSVKAWKTTGANSPWKPDSYKKMLVYRGAREWARVYHPSAIMGVMADDELMQLAYDMRAQAAAEIGVAGVAARLPGSAGFSAENVTRTIDQKPAEKAKGEEKPKNTKQAEKPAEKDTSSGQASDQTGDAGAGSASTPERISRAIFDDYASQIGRMNSTESVNKAHEKFWEGHGSKPVHPDDVSLVKLLIDVNRKRAAGEIEANGFPEGVKTAIDKSYEEKL